jgi:catechol 2,3-dioxygenase-like lactoylglutathione lyase family enzyme
MSDRNEMVSVRYMVDDVAKAVDFYTNFLDFKVLTSFPPAFADVARGNLRLLLSGPTSSAGRPMPDGTKRATRRLEPHPPDRRRHRGGSLASSAQRRCSVPQRPPRGPGGKQILLQDPSGNVVELFQPAALPVR